MRRFVPLATALALGGCGSLLMPPFGIQEGKLRPCDGLRGCVSSQAADPARRVAPIEFSSDRATAREHLLAVIRSYRDAQVVSAHPTYIRVEFSSREAVAAGPTVLMIDIAEFYFPLDTNRIEVRSMPRRNMPDSSENRLRIENIRQRFDELQSR